MRTVTYLVAASIDSRIARLDGSWDCFPQDEQLNADYFAMLKKFDTVLMGRGAYDVGLRAGITNPYPSMKSYVFSSSLPDSFDPNVTIVRGDPVPFVEKLTGEIYLCGGSQLGSTLMGAGLVDYVILKLNPFVMGEGLPLFDSEQMTTMRYLELLERPKQYPSGAVLLPYRVRR